jgi:hypothetical protein
MGLKVRQSVEVRPLKTSAAQMVRAILPVPKEWPEWKKPMMNEQTSPAMNPNSCEVSPGASEPKKKDGRGGSRPNTGGKQKKLAFKPSPNAMDILFRLARNQQTTPNSIAASLLEGVVKALALKGGVHLFPEEKTLEVGGTYAHWKILSVETSKERGGYYRVACPKCDEERIKNRQEMETSSMCSCCYSKQRRARSQRYQANQAQTQGEAQL